MFFYCKLFFMYECVFPFPPSINAAYGGGSGQKRFKSKAYKQWDAACPKLPFPANGIYLCPISISYIMYLPDKRRRDIGNYEKLVTDKLVSLNIIEDDNYKIIQEINIKFGGIDRDNPRIEVYIIPKD